MINKCVIVSMEEAMFFGQLNWARFPPHVKPNLTFGAPIREDRHVVVLYM